MVIGATLSGLSHVGAPEVGACLVAFLGAAAFWRIYFDRSAEAGMEVVVQSDDPGRLGRSAYHFVHPVMVAGIIVTAAADELVLAHPSHLADTATAALTLGGTALFLAGHAAFKAVVWRTTPWRRLGAIGVLTVMVPVAGQVSALVLAGAVAALVLLVAAWDRLAGRKGRTTSGGRPGDAGAI